MKTQQDACTHHEIHDAGLNDDAWMPSARLDKVFGCCRLEIDMGVVE